MLTFGVVNAVRAQFKQCSSVCAVAGAIGREIDSQTRGSARSDPLAGTQISTGQCLIGHNLEPRTRVAEVYPQIFLGCRNP